jgi:D-alanyl-D-alanine carboxypeptidase
MKRTLSFPRTIRFMAVSILTAGLVIFVGLGVESKIAPSASAVTTIMVQRSLAESNVAVAPNLEASLSKFSTPGSTFQSVSVSSLKSIHSPPMDYDLTESEPPVLETSYGHFPYSEDDPSRLRLVGQFVRDGYSGS